jgi:hypothetical protein
MIVLPMTVVFAYKDRNVVARLLLLYEAAEILNFVSAELYTSSAMSLSHPVSLLAEVTLPYKAIDKQQHYPRF